MSRIVGGILQVLMFSVLAAQVGPSNFGRICSALVVVQVLGTIFEFGFGPLLMSQNSLGKENRIVKVIISTTCLFAIFEGLIGILSYVNFNRENSFTSTLFLLLVWGAGERLSNIGLVLAISQKDASEVRKNILTRRLIVFLFFFTFSIIVTWSPKLFCAFMSLSSLFGGIVSSKYFRRYISQTTLTEIFKIVKLGLPFQANSLANQLRNLDIFLLNFLVSSSVAGNYALALRFAQSASIPLAALGQTGITAFSSGTKTDKSNYMKNYFRLFSISIVAALALIILFRVVSIQTHLPTFSNFDKSLQIQFLAFVFFGVIGIEISILQGMGCQNFVYQISILGAILSVTFIIIGGKLYNSVGASTALLLGNIIFAIVLNYSRSRNMKNI